MKYFCIIKENIAYMECVVQSMLLWFYSFYMFFSILLCNVASALVSDSNAYVWISNCIQIFELYSNVWIYIWILKECFWRNVFSKCSWKMASSDDVGKTISQLHPEPVNAYKKNLVFYWEGRGGCLCWAWRNAIGFSWTNVTKRENGE